MIRTTLEQKTTPPDHVWAGEVCMMGQGPRMCRFLMAGEKGFSCGKNSRNDHALNIMADSGEMEAVGDNCEGRAQGTLRTDRVQ